jgi:hypothetical protein
MKKFNILKTIVDFIWIYLCLGFSIFLVLVSILIFSNNEEKDLNLEFNGITINEIGINEKIILVFLIIFTAMIIYVYYQFKTLLRNIGRRKIFIDENIKIFKKMGNNLVISAFLYAIPIYIYQLYTKNIILSIGFNYFFVLLVLGLFFMVLSEIFQLSKIQKVENELTI